MNELTTDELQPHITILGWLYLIAHAVFLVLGVFVFLLLTGIGLASGDVTARSVLGIVGISVGLLLTIVALPGLAAGYGLLKRKSWARPLARSRYRRISRACSTSPTSSRSSAATSSSRPSCSCSPRSTTRARPAPR